MPRRTQGMQITMSKRLRNVILGLVGPIFAKNPLQNVLHTLNEMATSLYLPTEHYISATELFEPSNQKPDVARPDQGGFRIGWTSLHMLAGRDCLYQFRFYAEELEDLVHALHIPDPFITQNCSCFSGIEALCLLLAHFRSAGDMNDLVIMYCRSQSAISEVVNELSFWIEARWGHLLKFDTTGVLSSDKLELYAEAIHRAGAPIASVWGFLDCTIWPMCRPSRYQWQAYNGYKKVHALKYQAVKLPNGLLGHVHGPEVGRHNDNHLLSTSGLLDFCASYTVRSGTTPDTPPAQRHLQLFGDPAYGNSYHLMSPFSGVGERSDDEMRWNEAMARVRIEVEHGFGGVVRLWLYLNAWWKHRVNASPLGLYYRVGCLLTNAYNCVRPNQTSQFFECEPPTLEEYFHD